MPLAKQFPVKFTPRGLVDSLDATEKFHGACIKLSDLIFDQLNPELMVARPGVKVQADFAAGGFTTPGVISVQVTVGDVTYGMISSGRNPGKDEPFAYNNATSTFLTVSGITNNNSPATPSTTGPWTPPTMAVIGILLVVTHPGFPGGAIKYGWFDLTSPSAPVWSASDLSGNPLPSVPTAVANFFNRAYFACGQFLPFSDVLDATTRTSSQQSLTMGDTSIITALCGLPVQTTSSGVTQALLVFKAFQVWQITGDGSTLSQNYLSLTVGTQSPRTIWPCVFGVYFSSGGGPYYIDAFGAIHPLVAQPGKDSEPDIQAPFQNAVVPSRAAGCYTDSIYRVCLETIIRGVDSVNDYWFDEHRRRWSGPHTFSFDCASSYSNYMILCSNANPGFLYRSDVMPSNANAYTDNGVTYMPTLQSSTFPKEGHMTQKQVVESTIELAAASASQSYNITAQDEQQNTLGLATISIVVSGKLWGSNVWGDGSRWGAAVSRPRVYNVNWPAALNFQKMSLIVSSPASAAMSIGTFFARYQDLGYQNAVNP